MQKPKKSKFGENDANTNPDFYRLNLIAPLPDNNSTGDSLMPAESTATSIENSGSQNGSNTTEQVGCTSLAGGGMDSSTNTNVSSQTILPQNLVALSQQLSGLNPSLQATSGGIVQITGSTNAEVNQLDLLRKRKDDLMRQLQVLQTSQNGISTIGAVQAGGGIQSPSLQLGVDGNQQIRQVTINIPGNMHSQMGGQLNGHQVNMVDLVGNTSAKPGGALNQQLSLIQKSLLEASNANFGNNEVANNNL